MRRGLPRYRERPTRAIIALACLIGIVGVALIALMSMSGGLTAQFVPIQAIDPEGRNATFLLSNEDGKAVKVRGLTPDRLLLSGWEGYLPPGCKVRRVVARAVLTNSTPGFSSRLSFTINGMNATEAGPWRKQYSKTWSCTLSRHGVNSAQILSDLVLTIRAGGQNAVSSGWFDRVWIEVTYSAHWWNRGWKYRTPVKVEGNHGAQDLSDYQILVNVDTHSLVTGGRMEADGSDIRFLDQDDLTELPYWIESGMETAHTRIWVRIPSIPANGTRTIWLYHGNRRAGPRTSGAKTFVFFSSFETGKVLPVGEGFQRFEDNPLIIKEYKGTGVVHPDVLYFPGRANGYKFWMYYTPYPPDSAELPSLVRSNDGIHFTDKGVHNPVITPGKKGDWDDGLLADPDVVRVGDTWYLYYAGRPANKSWQKIGVAVSQDGKTFRKVEDNPVLSADIGLSHESHNFLMSPTVYHNKTGFYMWYFSEGAEADKTLVWMCGARSADGIHWTKLPTNPLMSPLPSSYDMKAVWHGDVIFRDGSFLLYYVANDGADYTLCLARSSNGVNWTRSGGNPILVAVPETWESLRIYRSSPVVVDDGIWLYYSAFNVSFQCRIGLARSRAGLEVSGPDLGQWDVVEGDARASGLHARGPGYSLVLVGSQLYPKVRKGLGGPYEYSAWYYDDMSNSRRTLALLRLFDSRSSFIGVGVYPAANATHYVYHSYPLRYAASTIARRAGWHRLSISVGQSTCRMSVDGQEVAESAVLDERNLTSFGLEGYLDGASFFDDVTVRKASEREPASLVLAGHERKSIL